MKLISCALVTLLACVHPGVAATQAEPQGCFRAFDASGFKGKPDFTRYGFEPATVIYAVNHFWPGKKHTERLPERSAVRSMIRQYITGQRRQVPALTVIDVENWPNVGADEMVASSVQKYLTLLSWVREDVGEGSMSYYAVPPLRDYWRAARPPASDLYKQWQGENDRFARLADAVDAFTPSLYTFYDDPGGWERHAIANIAEARRLAKGKPVYPFIWPHYHDQSKLKGFIPKDYWMVQLRTLERHADGMVLWAGQEAWNAKDGWWQATEEFMRDSKRLCRGVQPQSPELHSPEAK